MKNKIKDIAYVDMDNTICDLYSRVIQIEPKVKRNEFKKHSKRIADVLEAHPFIFHDLDPMPHAIEKVKGLFDLYDVYFLSTPMWSIPESFAGKRIWIDNHFGNQAERRLILTHRKDLNIGRFLVDDSLTHHGVNDFKGEHIHFGSKKFPDWIPTFDYLESKAGKKNKR